jgi:ribonucleoside-diphosphate reductase beta chain
MRECSAALSLVSHSSSLTPRLLDPGFELTLRPMRYPQFYEMYRDAIRNTWTVEEVDFSLDTNDLKHKVGPAERHLIERLVAFFATGDSIVANNLVLNLYQHINAPEARMYLSRQLTKNSLPDIGRQFGGKDHTTVLHGCDKIKRLVENDGQFRDEVDQLIRAARF